MKPKNIINIINVYAPTSDQARKYPNELKKLYKNLDKLCKGLGKAPSSITMLAGNFNSKVGRRTGPENCIRHWSRGKRNQNGTNLIEFCGRMVKSSQTAASNILQITSQPGRKEELTWWQRKLSRYTIKLITLTWTRRTSKSWPMHVHTEGQKYRRTTDLSFPE